MAEIDAFDIKDVVGWKPTDDKEHVLVNFRQASGAEFTIAIPHGALINIITSLVGALGAFAVPKLSSESVFAIPVDWFEVGTAVDNPQMGVLTLRMDNGGSLTFQMTRLMLERLAETLNSMTQAGATDLPPGMTKQ